MRTQYYLFMLIVSTLFFTTFSMEQKEKKTVQFSPKCTVKGYKKDQPYEELFQLESILLSDKQSNLRNLQGRSKKKSSEDNAEFPLPISSNPESISSKSSLLAAGLGLGALYCIIRSYP